MTRMVIDPHWAEQLRDSSGVIEMVTPDGKALGTFYPKQPSRDEMMACCPYSEEELNQMADEARRSGTGREWPAILRDLEAQWPSMSRRH